MTYIQTTSPRTAVFYGESMADLALMPTTTKIGEGEYIHALAQEGSYAIILLTDGLKKFMLRSTGWVEVKDQGGGGSGWFEPGGNTTFAELPTPSEDNVGIVYNITDAFTTDERFNEGAGIDYPAGTNVAIVNVGTDSTPVYKFDTYVGAYTTDDELSLVSENPVQNKVITSEINKINTALQNKQDELTFDQVPTQGSNNPVRSGGLYNSLGGKSALTFLQAFDSSVSQLQSGFVFTPSGANTLYNTLMSIMYNSALPSVMPKVYWFAVQGSDWDEYGKTVIDLQNDFQIVIPQTNYNQLIVQDGLNYWNDYAMELGNVNTDESGNITTVEFRCNIYNTQDPPSNPPTYMEFIIISTPATKNGAASLSALYESPGLKALADKPNIDYTPSYTNTYNSIYIDQKVAGEEITATATGTDLTLSAAEGSLNKLTVYGKSEVVNNKIISAGEGGSIEVETCEKNLLDPTKLVTENITYTGGTLSGTATNFRNAYSAGIPIIFSKTRQITLSFKVYTSSTQNEGRGLIIAFVYTDNTRDTLNIPNNTTTSQFFTLTSNSAKQMQYIAITFGAEGANMWHLSEIQLEYGSSATTYEPYSGTMATFSTGTPLRGIPDTTVRDVMTWDGSAGTVTKNCGEVDLGTLDWTYATNPEEDWAVFGAPVSNIVVPSQLPDRIKGLLCPLYSISTKMAFSTMENKSMLRYNGKVYIKDNDFTDAETFKSAMNGVKLVYELATSITEQLTADENDSIAGLRTFQPQTHAQNNAGATMTIEAYAETANGKAVQELKQDVQSEISALKITQSDTLTLTTAGWTNNAQTVTYAHDMAKRNVIDVDPASVEEWASCGVLAISETVTGITFKCSTVPENALNFRVTSMGV